jgi:hypothetical protein
MIGGVFCKSLIVISKVLQSGRTLFGAIFSSLAGILGFNRINEIVLS